MKILVNAISTKKSSGGAYQITYNFLLNTIGHPQVEWVYVVSKDLDDILPASLKGSGTYFVFPTQPDFRHSYIRVRKELAELVEREKPDVVYSITAPSYFTFKTKEVMRFTNPWVTHPNKYSWATLSLSNKIKTRIYCWNQRRMMRRANYFVTQTETTKAGIVRITRVPEKNVCVVKNVLPSVFLHANREHIDASDNYIHIACVGAPVPHKNFDIIPEVLLSLKEQGIENVRFHVTIPENDWMWQIILSKLDANKINRSFVINHGRLLQKDLAEMYRRCSFCFLPTLLEVFSVSTLEAMFFDLKIVATDLPFNREVLEDAALYYEPKNAKEAADRIACLISNDLLQKDLSLKMKKRLSLYNDYEKHFNAILSFLEDVAYNRI